MSTNLLLIRLSTIILLILPLILVTYYCQSKMAQVSSNKKLPIVIMGNSNLPKISPLELDSLEREKFVFARTFQNESLIVLIGGKKKIFPYSLTQLEQLKLKKLRLPRVNQSYIVNENCGCYYYTTRLNLNKKIHKYFMQIYYTKDTIEIPERYEGLVEYLFSECPTKHK